MPIHQLPRISHRITASPDFALWDAYVCSHPKACLYHLSIWLRVIHKTYGHSVYGLAATEVVSGLIAGVLPLVHMKHPLFGNKLVSMPFFDMGGVLADTPAIEKDLLGHALSLAQDLGAKSLELRHAAPLAMLSGELCLKLDFNSQPVHCFTASRKVRMLLDLPGSSDALMKSFKSKLRNQINRPLKEGLKVKSGGAELVDEFYQVFLENMRDLGSPVHAKRLFENVVAEFQDKARIFLVHKAGLPLAAALTVGFNGTLENPWASALRRYSQLSPNMLLYWGMLDYAAQNAFALFNFGRSTPGEGTFKFKEQWGAHPGPLYWHSIGGKNSEDGGGDVGRFKAAAAVWKGLPVWVTKILGPPLRKHISL
jgi:FemAB-related protein (PEP-CTERM system-associated)